MSEIQYCEDCKHVLPYAPADNDDALGFAKCKARPKPDPHQYIARKFHNKVDESRLSFCTTVRLECGDTCPKFEARDG